MRFVSVVHDYGRWLNQSPFRPRAEVSFPCARQFSEYNGKEASASRELVCLSKTSQKELGQNARILASCLINNPYNINFVEPSLLCFGHSATSIFHFLLTLRGYLRKTVWYLCILRQNKQNIRDGCIIRYEKKLMWNALQ